MMCAWFHVRDISLFILLNSFHQIIEKSFPWAVVASAGKGLSNDGNNYTKKLEKEQNAKRK